MTGLDGNDAALYCIRCGACGASISDTVFNALSPGRCESCGVLMEVAVFPALFSEPAPVTSGESLVVEDEAGCFYHPGKRAVVHCASCGKFLCSLCQVELGDRKLCPNCVELGKNRGRLTELITQRTLYDQISLSLVIWPLLSLIFFWVTIVTAPMAVYVAVRYWKAPTSVVRRSKIRFILAVFIALIQVGGWTALLTRLLLKRLV